jgi:hypothetical protein
MPKKDWRKKLYFCYFSFVVVFLYQHYISFKGKCMSKVIPINQQYDFEDGLIVSSTNLDGIITYANRKFCEIAGYDKMNLSAQITI